MKHVMFRSFSLAALIAASGCNLSGLLDPPAPGELSPLFTSIEGLPGYLDDADTPDPFEMPVRNIGEATVTVTGIHFEDLDGNAGESANFFDVENDTDTVEQNDQFILRFKWRTPGGVGQSALLVIESDAEVNPRLEVEVHSTDYAEPSDDAGVSEDAGSPAEDAGTSEDAGASADAGGDGDDAGNAADAGASGDDAGSSADAGA